MSAVAIRLDEADFGVADGGFWLTPLGLTFMFECVFQDACGALVAITRQVFG